MKRRTEKRQVENTCLFLYKSLKMVREPNFDDLTIDI